MLKLRARPFPFVISGPSGVGKTVICRGLLERNREMCRVITVTTRPRRKGEKPEVDYHFVNKQKFEEMKKEGDLLEWAEVHDAGYGTPRREVEGYLGEGRIPLLNVDVQGALAIREQIRDSVLVFVLPPDEETIRTRLEKRGTDDAETIRRRLIRAREEMKVAPQYDYIVVNDKLDRCIAQIDCIYQAELLKPHRCLEPGAS
jgi:guanylate kinase